MLLTEFDDEPFAEPMREEGFEEGFAKGERIGAEKGERKAEQRLSQLCLKLVAEKRPDDLERATRDKDFRDSLYLKYGL